MLLLICLAGAFASAAGVCSSLPLRRGQRVALAATAAATAFTAAAMGHPYLAALALILGVGATPLKPHRDKRGPLSDGQAPAEGAMVAGPAPDELARTRAEAYDLLAGLLARPREDGRVALIEQSLRSADEAPDPLEQLAGYRQAVLMARAAHTTEPRD